jgi:hypothetical protein
VVYYCFGRAGITGSASARTLILIIIIRPPQHTSFFMESNPFFKVSILKKVKILRELPCFSIGPLQHKNEYEFQANKFTVENT